MGEQPPKPPAIDLRHLRYFLAVFQELHFGRAADRLHIAQPPLSQAIRKLEDELGVELFQRTSRVVSATEAGKAFAEHAHKVLSTFDLAVAEARRAAGVGSVVRVGCGLHVPIDPLLRFLDTLRAADPSVQIEVTHLLALEQVRRLRDGELDFGVFAYAEKHQGIDLVPLFLGQPLTTLLPPAHRLTVKDVLTPADLRSEVLVTFPRFANPALADRLSSMMNEAGYRFRDVREAAGTDERDLVLEVAAGHGVALTAASNENISEVHANIVRRPLDPPLSMPHTVLASRSSPPRGLQWLVAAAQRAAHELQQEL